MEYSILKGSITHILQNLYILSHKIDMKNYQKLLKQITKNIYDFDKHFKKIYQN